MNEIKKCNLQFSIFTRGDDGDDLIDTGGLDEHDIRILAEAYISLIVSLKGDTNSNEYKLHSTSKKFEKKMWLNGRSVGYIKGELYLETSPFIQQMACGVMTENGVAKSSSIFKKKGKSEFKVKIHPKMKEIKQYKEQLVDSAFTVLGTKNVTEELRNNITSSLSSLQKVLLSSDKESLKSFIYEGKGEIMKAQEILIDTGIHLAEYCGAVDEQFRAQYYKTLHFLMKRGELNLEYISFEDK